MEDLRVVADLEVLPEGRGLGPGIAKGPLRLLNGEAHELRRGGRGTQRADGPCGMEPLVVGLGDRRPDPVRDIKAGHEAFDQPFAVHPELLADGKSRRCDYTPPWMIDSI